MMGWKLLDKSIGLISTLVLVRVLTPADFGLVAMAMAVVALVELMGAFGFDTALIQRQDSERHHYDTAWTFGVIFGIAIAIILLMLAVPAANFYHEPRLQLMLPVLAISALISGFGNIGTVAFRKELDFRKEFNFLLIKRLVGFAINLALALTFRSFWALIFSAVIGTIMSVFISYIMHPYRPRFNLVARGDLLHFSKWIFISNLIQFLHSRSTDFILGRTVGSYGLGIYNIANEIAVMPSTELIAPLNRAVYPIYTRLASTQDKLKERFLEVFGIISLLAFPIAIGLYCVSTLVVSVLLGPQWKAAVPIMQIAGLSGLMSALQSNMYLAILAIGQPKANTFLSGGLLIVSLPAVVLASLHFGVVGAAYAHFVSALLGFGGIVIVFSRVIRFPKSSFFVVMWRPIFASGAMALVLYGMKIVLSLGLIDVGLVTQLALLVTLGAVTYIVGVLSLWFLVGRPSGAEKMILEVLRAKILTTHRARSIRT